MLEFDDIQHILLTRAPALTGRYEFLSFRNAAGGRAWLSAILAKAQSAAEVRFDGDGQSLGERWRSPGTDCARSVWTRLRWPPSPRSSGRAWSPARRCSATPEPTIPITGWAASPAPDLHAIAILFARDAAERDRCQVEHANFVARVRGRGGALHAGSGGDAAVRLRT